MIRLAFRPPYDLTSLLAFLAVRAIPGVERVDATSYARTVALASGRAVVRIRRLPAEPALALDVRGAPPRERPALVATARRVFDLDAEPGRVSRAFRRDPLLGPLVKRQRGLRVPGAWDPFECAVRAVLGQQVSVAAGRTFALRLVDRLGRRFPRPTAGLTHLFPTPTALAAGDLSGIGLTTARASALRGLGRAVADGRLDLHASTDEVVAGLRALPGFGEWTASYVALRALGDHDAFLAADLVLRRVAAAGAPPLSARALAARADLWRPFRSYAVLHLWRAAGAQPARHTAPRRRRS